MPHNPLSREQVQTFFESRKIRDQTVLVSAEGSHLRGMRRLLIREPMVKNVYKGRGEPLDALTKDNPMIPVDLDELKFEEHIFVQCDPAYLAEARRREKTLE